MVYTCVQVLILIRVWGQSFLVFWGGFGFTVYVGFLFRGLGFTVGFTVQ